MRCNVCLRLFLINFSTYVLLVYTYVGRNPHCMQVVALYVVYVHTVHNKQLSEQLFRQVYYNDS